MGASAVAGATIDPGLQLDGFAVTGSGGADP